MTRDPHNPFTERAIGLALLGTILFCAASGAGIGVFLQEPELGGLVGGAVGLVAGIWLIPPLMRDWLD